MRLPVSQKKQKENLILRSGITDSDEIEFIVYKVSKTKEELVNMWVDISSKYPILSIIYKYILLFFKP